MIERVVGLEPQLGLNAFPFEIAIDGKVVAEESWYPEADDESSGKGATAGNVPAGDEGDAGELLSASETLLPRQSPVVVNSNNLSPVVVERTVVSRPRTDERVDRETAA